MTDISFKNADGSARNTPRFVTSPDGTSVDTKDGSVDNPVEEVDVILLQRVEDEVKSAIEGLEHNG